MVVGSAMEFFHIIMSAPKDVSIHTIKCIGLSKRPSLITDSAILNLSIHMPLKMLSD